MAFFSKVSHSGQRLAVVQDSARLDLVSITRGRDTQPRVMRCESYPLDGTLTATLTRLRQGGKLNGACVTLLQPGEYHLLSIDAPSLPESAPAAELRNAVRWQIKDMVDYPIAAAGVDVLRIPPQPGRPAQLLAAAASHVLLKDKIEAFQEAKVDLSEISLPEVAQRNIAQLFEIPDRALALLVFNTQGGLMTLTCNGQLYASRRIDLSATELARDPSYYERVVLDVQRSLDNFDRNFSQLSLQRLLVLPVPGADDFVAHLRDNLYQPVEVLNIADGLDISAAPLLANTATLADALPALGLALPPPAQAATDLNLFDAALQRQYDAWSARNLGLGLSAAALLCAVWGGWAHWRQAQAEQSLLALEPVLQAARSEAKQLSDKIAGHQADVNLQAELSEGRLRLHARTEVLALLQRGLSPANAAPAEWLRGFARQIPQGLWLTAFHVNAENGALEIRGRTSDPKLIPEYLRRLNAETAFQGRTFAALEISSANPDASTAATSAPVPAVGAALPAIPAIPIQPGREVAPATTAATTPYHEFVLTSAALKSSGGSS